MPLPERGLLSLGRYFFWWTISSSITRPVVTVSVLTWLITYIYYWNLQLLIMKLLSKLRLSSLRH